MAKQEFTLEGLDGIVKTMEQLPKELIGKSGGPIRRGLRAGALLIRDDAKRRAPVKTGALRDNIVIQLDRKPQLSKANERFRVGVKAGAKAEYKKSALNVRLGRVGQTYNKPSTTFYWRFHEFGTEKMQARPFLRPAFESNVGNALQVFITETERGLHAIAKKLARQNKGR